MATVKLKAPEMAVKVNDDDFWSPEALSMLDPKPTAPSQTGGRKLLSDEERVNFLRANLIQLRLRQEEALETLNKVLYTTSELTEEEKKVLEKRRMEGPDRLHASKSEWKAKAKHMMKNSSFNTIKDITFDDHRSEMQWELARDKEASCWSRWLALCQIVAESQSFEYCLALIIVINSVLLSIDLNLSVENGNVLPPWVDIPFVLIYLIEMFIRMCAMGICGYFCDPWCIFDFFLTFSALVNSMLLPLLAVTAGIDTSVDELRVLMIMRTLRILRLIRALRALQYFRTVWRLVHGLLTSGNAMLSTCLLIFLTLYIGACLGIEIITKDERLRSHEETGPIVTEHFPGLAMTLLTLSRFVSLDSAASIYTPLIMQKPILLFYFGAIMIFVSIALMNLVTATLVEGALMNAQHDRELDILEKRDRLRRALPTLLELFYEMDSNGDEILTLEEMKAVPTSLLPPEVFEGSPVASMEDLFLAFDVSGDGELTQREFLEGFLSVFTAGVPIQTVQTMKLLYKNEHQIGEVKKDLALALHCITRLTEQLGEHDSSI